DPNDAFLLHVYKNFTYQSEFTQVYPGNIRSATLSLPKTEGDVFMFYLAGINLIEISQFTTSNPILTDDDPTEIPPPHQPLQVEAIQVDSYQIQLRWYSDANKAYLYHTYKDGQYQPQFSGLVSGTIHSVTLHITYQDSGSYNFFVSGLNAFGEISLWAESDLLQIDAPAIPLEIIIVDDLLSDTDIS